MKCLIVEDDFTSRLLLQEILLSFGKVHIAANGKEAVEAVHNAIVSSEPYNLILLDIIMPEMNGSDTLLAIRELEEANGLPLGRGSTIMMTTSLTGPKYIFQSFRDQCDAYLTKPIDEESLFDALREHGCV